MLNKVDVYYIMTSTYLSASDFLYSFLSKEEKTQSQKFFTSDLGNKYIITRAVLRAILSKYLKISPQEIVFTTNGYGKPFVQGSNIEFNMSHSRDCVYYAIAYGFAVGIDVEFYDREKNIFNLIKGVFSSNELEFFLNLPDFALQDFFFTTWTKKEATIKAMGLGLAYPMEQVDTILESRIGYIPLSESRYYLHALKTNDQYKAHLVVQNRRDTLVNQCKFLSKHMMKIG